MAAPQVDNAVRLALVGGSALALSKAEGITFDTYYPGGLFGTMTFVLKTDVTHSLGIKPHQRIIATNGQTTVWEGEVIAPTYMPGVGFRYECAGAWATKLEPRGVRKPWADTRLSEEAWQYVTTTNGAEKCSIDRQSRIRFTPKREDWATNEYAAVVYIPPTGQTIKRITGTINLQEGAQQWALVLYNNTVPGSVITYNSNQTNTALDQTLATPSSSLAFSSGRMAIIHPPSVTGPCTRRSQISWCTPRQATLTSPRLLRTL
jgi:hypothetical protein